MGALNSIGEWLAKNKIEDQKRTICNLAFYSDS